MIRNLREGDIDEIKKIWERYYQLQFPFPDFLNYLCAFVVVDDSNGSKIITAGGVRTIAELLIVTDISTPLMTRHRAFRETLQASKYVAVKSGFNNLNAIVKDDPKWASILSRIGFETDTILTLEL